MLKMQVVKSEAASSWGEKTLPLIVSYSMNPGWKLKHLFVYVCLSLGDTWETRHANCHPEFWEPANLSFILDQPSHQLCNRWRICNVSFISIHMIFCLSKHITETFCLPTFTNPTRTSPANPRAATSKQNAHRFRKALERAQVDPKNVSRNSRNRPSPWFLPRRTVQTCHSKLNLEDPQILRLLKGNEWRDLWRKGLNLVPKKHNYVKVCESHWKP